MGAILSAKGSFRKCINTIVRVHRSEVVSYSISRVPSLSIPFIGIQNCCYLIVVGSVMMMMMMLITVSRVIQFYADVMKVR